MTEELIDTFEPDPHNCYCSLCENIQSQWEAIKAEHKRLQEAHTHTHTWISPKDKLPEEAVKILIYSPIAAPWVGDMEVTIGEFSPHGGDHFRIPGLNIDIKDVVGWMLLPKGKG